jgi:hypothetical protein
LLITIRAEGRKRKPFIRENIADWIIGPCIPEGIKLWRGQTRHDTTRWVVNAVRLMAGTDPIDGGDRPDPIGTRSAPDQFLKFANHYPSGRA